MPRFLDGIVSIWFIQRWFPCTFACNGFDHDNIRRDVFNNIWFGIGTSMFASIAIGLGVDFAIHTMDRVKQLRIIEKY